MNDSTGLHVAIIMDGNGRWAAARGLPRTDGHTEGEENLARIVRVAVNGRIVAGFVPFRGWREYRLPVAPGTYRRGFNELQLAVREPDGNPQRLAVARFRLLMN